MENGSIRKPHASFGITDFLLRWGASLLLVLITYNPSGKSYVHWVWDAFGGEGLGAVHFFTGAVLLAGWAIFLYATSRSLGTVGSVLGAIVIGTTVWLLADIGLVRADSTAAIVWLALISLATLLAIGLSWSHIWRRISGQLEVDDDD